MFDFDQDGRLSKADLRMMLSRVVKLPPTTAAATAKSSRSVHTSSRVPVSTADAVGISSEKDLVEVVVARTFEEVGESFIDFDKFAGVRVAPAIARLGPACASATPRHSPPDPQHQPGVRGSVHPRSVAECTLSKLCTRRSHGRAQHVNRPPACAP